MIIRTHNIDSFFEYFKKAYPLKAVPLSGPNQRVYLFHRVRRGEEMTESCFALIAGGAIIQYESHLENKVARSEYDRIAQFADANKLTDMKVNDEDEWIF